MYFGVQTYYTLKVSHAAFLLKSCKVVLNYSEETLLENAELFYNPEGGTYTEETILEAEAVTEYEVNEKRVSRQEYEEARGRYRRYVPLEMCERR